MDALTEYYTRFYTYKLNSPLIPNVSAVRQSVQVSAPLSRHALLLQRGAPVHTTLGVVRCTQLIKFETRGA